MDWTESLLDRLATPGAWAYRSGGPPATEPAALAALALVHGGRHEQAARPLDWLAEVQAGDGSLGISRSEATPCWPTSLAILAWSHAAQTLPVKSNYSAAAARAARWLLAAAGKSMPRVPQFGHDPSLVGWSWAEGTHSWVEPTAWSVLALKAADYSSHARTREAVALLADRLLASGGCNYGNTTVLGQELRPHVQPSGLALAALAGEAVASAKISASVDYLRRELSADTPTSSLAYGLLGLTAVGERPPHANRWLQNAAARLKHSAGADRLALLVLAASHDCPLTAAIAPLRS